MRTRPFVRFNLACGLLALLVLPVALAVAQRTDAPALRSSRAGAWWIERVDAPHQFGEMRDRSLALDVAGHPHIAYGGDFLYYAHYDGTSWHSEVVDSSPRVGTHASLALDGLGRPHISYRDWNRADLKYAAFDGSAWQIEVVDSAGNVGEYNSLALDAEGRPHISYYDETLGDLKYACRQVCFPVAQLFLPLVARNAGDAHQR